jgi:rhodanese-related sulfurtransferase
MQKSLFVIIGLLGALLAAHYIKATAGSQPPVRPVSGKIDNGYRILPIEKSANPIELVVYRGDYIKFQVNAAVAGRSLVIPGLAIEQELPREDSTTPYFKMKRTGSFAFSLGDVSGLITVIAYRQEKYTEVSSADGARIIADRSPLILDVRTPGEFKRGHLRDAVLIPVQVLQQNLAKLETYKDRDILVYCATGNRSTVASKILIDAGFNRVINLRHGIVDWYRNKQPIVQ